MTASNDEQANAFQSQITYRQNKNVLPCKTKYLVLPDPDGKRVGSGGATLQVLRKLAEQEDIAGDFHNKRILVIHSGGDSKRVPQYVESFFRLYHVNFLMEERQLYLMSFL